MSVIDELITDRTQADVDTLTELLGKPFAQWTAEQLAEFNQAISKGAYNYTDLNRVTACMDYLNEVLTGLGYETGYQKIRITHQQDPDNPLPGEYTRLEYIESAGAQYINTGIIPSSKTKIAVDFQVTQKTAENNDIFGVVGQFAFRQYMNNDFFRTVSGSFADFSSDVSIFSRHTVVKTMESTVIDDIYSAYTLPSTVVNHLLLFAYSSGESIYNYGYLRMYSCAIYDDDSLVRNYIPCVDSNGVAGLYDTISKQFYSSSGTSAFLAGAYLTDDQPPAVDPYLWYEDDIPTIGLLDAYIANVAALRGTVAVLPTTPATPESMKLLDYIKANNIEKILVDINQLLSNMAAAWFYSGEVYSGEVDA